MPVQSNTQIISRDDQQVFANLECRPFAFRHRLSSSPLLRIGRLRELARYMESHNLSYYFQDGSGRMSGWGDQPRRTTLSESFDRLAGGNVLVMLKGVHRHPDYALLLDTFLADLGDLLRVDMRKAYRRPICTIIVASPRRITPYHVDDSHNLLLQIQGRKSFHVFDGTDPEIMTAAERDAFWNGDVNAARHTEAKQARATRYELGPGTGVHVPFLYPHWAENGDEVSVAVSMNFQSTRDRALDVHAFNNLLRSRGFHPAAPGHNRLVDSSKVVAYRALSSLRHLSERAAP